MYHCSMKWPGFMLIGLFILSSCSGSKSSNIDEELPNNTEKTDTLKPAANTGHPWENHGGYSIRKNDAFQKELEHKTALRVLENENTVSTEGTSRMQLCEKNKITIYSKVKPSSGNGNLIEISDTGTYTVYEDQRGNLYLRFLMKKSGEGFVEIQFSTGEISLTGPGGIEKFALKPGGC